MKNIIKFNGKLYAPLEEGAHTIQGEVIEVCEVSGEMMAVVEAAREISKEYYDDENAVMCELRDRLKALASGPSNQEGKL